MNNPNRLRILIENAEALNEAFLPEISEITKDSRKAVDAMASLELSPIVIDLLNVAVTLRTSMDKGISSRTKQQNLEALERALEKIPEEDRAGAREVLEKATSLSPEQNLTPLEIEMVSYAVTITELLSNLILSRRTGGNFHQIVENLLKPIEIKGIELPGKPNPNSPWAQ